MTTESHTLSVTGVRVAVVRKAIKNLHLGVYPPDGHVRVAAPLAVSDAAVRVAIIGKLPWIRRQRAAFQHQARQSKREMVAGESHYYLGRRYRLTVETTDGPSGVVLRGTNTMELRMRLGSGAEQGAGTLQRWYRERLRERAAPLLAKWARTLGVTVRRWGVKRMKTKWGSCNVDTGSVWLNLELAKKAPACLEYVVVHELVHLRVRHHDARFHALMDQHLPSWRATRKRLNAAPLASEAW
jgi:predicted metal-dependent hydrolase